MQLSDSTLLRMQGYIDGRWETAAAGATREVVNPATHEKIGTVPNMGAVEARRAIAAAHGALPGWAAKTAKERAVILRRWYNLMMENQEDLAILTRYRHQEVPLDLRAEVHTRADRLSVAWRQLLGAALGASEAEA